MQRLWLDYQRSDPERRRPGVILFAVGVVAAALTSVDYLAVAAERDDAQAQVEGLRRTAEQRRAASAQAPAAPARASKAVAPSAARWESLFASLEGAADDSVTLLTLHPTEKEIQLGGEAKDVASAIDYVQRLQSQPALANARMTKSETIAENPQHPVRFELVADWRSAR